MGSLFSSFQGPDLSLECGMFEILKPEEILHSLRQKRGSVPQYLAMYSSWAGGIITDPALMVVPVDDHIVHRGDGVFEAIKTVDRKIYLLHSHLDRLERSAQSLHLPLPFSRVQMEELIKTLLRSVDKPECMIRLYVSRGAGGFTTNPYESTGSQLYCVITDFKPIAPEKYEEGVKIKASRIKAKEPFFARIKSCNYLPNVLMKKEAVDENVDFVVSLSDEGWITESSTENIAFLNANDELVFPSFDLCLKGTTLAHVLELAKQLKSQSVIRDIVEGRCAFDDLRKAKEIFMVGTTLDVLRVSQVDDVKVGGTFSGSLAEKLLQLIRADQKTNAAIMTAFQS